MINIVLVDDQIILRDSLKFIIEQDNEICVVGVASNGREAFQVVQNTKPDVVLMDIMMPGSNGIEGTALIKEKFPEIKILILTTFDDEENVRDALKNCADGYILKDVKPQELLISIKNIYNGMVVMHKNVYQKAVNAKPVCEPAPFGKSDVRLTEREISIVELIVNGKSNKEISQELFLSEGTVKNILTNILEKLELRDRTQLAVYAIKNRII